MSQGMRVSHTAVPNRPRLLLDPSLTPTVYCAWNRPSGINVEPTTVQWAHGGGPDTHTGTAILAWNVWPASAARHTGQAGKGAPGVTWAVPWGHGEQCPVLASRPMGGH